jgi:hypothetical protein
MRRVGKLGLTVVAAVAGSLAAAACAYAAFSAGSSNPGNSFSAGTVAIADNDGSGSLLSLSSARPGDSMTRCIRVQSQGDLDAVVHLYGTVSGALAPYLSLTVTRGTDTAPSYPSCAAFTADASDYVGAGPGVVYSGTLAGYPSSYGAGVVDPVAASPETWTTSEAHSYLLSITLNNDPAAQGLVADASFTWEARGGFTSTTSNGGNSFSAAPDWVRPAVSRTAIAKSTGGTPGFIKQGGSYYVYANVTDSGNPASGVASVNANVGSISTGQTAAPLTSGSWTIGGQTYNYRSALLTADAVLPEGARSYSIASADSAANGGTDSGSVTIDNTAPRATDVQTANGGATPGKAELNDSVTLTFSEPIEPDSILAGWNGSPTDAVVQIANSGTNDVLTVRDSANAAQLPLGSVVLGGNYVTATRTFGATGNKSRMAMSGSSITVTLGTASGATPTAAAAGTMSWTPSSIPFDAAGVYMLTTSASETGAADLEF